MLEIEYNESSLIVEVDDKFSLALQGKIPFTTSLNVWKEEIYFLTPIEIDVSGLGGYAVIESGGLYYWPEEKGFCIFYGISQPYSLVYPLGSYIGILGDLRKIEDGTKATVKFHKLHEPCSDIIAKLKSLGFKVSTPLRYGERVVETVKYINGVRTAFRLYVENGGVHIECEPIFQRDYNPLTLRLLEKLKKIVSQGRYVRLDLSEDGWVNITCFVSDVLKEIQEAMNEMSTAYCKIIKTILTD